MAVGFPPSHKESRDYEEDPKDLIRAVEAACEDLDWSFHRSGRWRIVATIPFQFFVTYGESVTIVVEEDGEVAVCSTTSYALQWIDWGRNYGNVTKFFRAFEDVLDERAERRRKRREG